MDSEQVLKNLLVYGFDYAQTLCGNYTKGNALFQFTKLLLSFYQSYNRGQDLVQWAILQQIQCTPHAEELFREGSTATSLSHHLFHYDQMGTKYLHGVVGPLVGQLVAHPSINKVEKADADADQNLELLFTFIDDFMERLVSTVQTCPIHIRELFLFLKKEAGKKFQDTGVVVSSVLFLRFILPAVITPEQYETPVGQKGLILAARIVQSIANMCEVEQFKWSNYSKLNSFIVRMLPKMETFMSALLNEEKIREGKIIIEASVSFKPNVSEREATFRDLLRFLESEHDRNSLNLPRVLSNRRKTPEEMQRRLIELNLDEHWKLQKSKKGCSLFSLRSEDTPLAISKLMHSVPSLDIFSVDFHIYSKS